MGTIQETVENGMVAPGEASLPAAEDAITLVFLADVSVPGLGSYRRGDVADVENAIADDLLAVGRGEDKRVRIVKRYKDETTTIPEHKRARGRV